MKLHHMTISSGKGGTPQHQQPGARGRRVRQRERPSSGRGVSQFGGADGRAVQAYVAAVDEHAVLEAGVDVEGHAGARVQGHLGAEQGCEGPDR
ncbi:hypothetical protein STENM327S_08799 [Streptomyces tendae]